MISKSEGDRIENMWLVVWNLILWIIKESYYTLKMSILGIPMLFMEFCETRTSIELPNRAGEVAVVTGGVRGFGLEIVKKLLKCGFTVIVGDVYRGELDSLVDSEGMPDRKVKYIHLDLSSKKAVRLFAKNVLEETNRIDLLFNNAGVMYPKQEETGDGYESNFQINYLGHFLLTQLLLPIMKSTAEKKDLCCRIVYTASCAHYFANFDYKNPEKWRTYSGAKAYCDSKFAVVMHTKYLNRMLQKENAKVHVYSVHPGMIKSRLQDNISIINKFVFALGNAIMGSLLRSTVDGADGILYAAFSPELEDQGGLYLDNCKAVQPKAETEFFYLQQQLWKKSLQLIKIED